MARSKKATTVEERQHNTDLRIQRKFGITLADREQRAKDQEGQCKICGGPLDAYGPPNVDHFHFHVRAYRTMPGGWARFALAGKWSAYGYDEAGQVKCTRVAATKAAAVSAVTQAMMPWSIRGLLCFKCNRGLGYVERFFNAASHPENLLPVVAYLRARLEKA